MNRVVITGLGLVSSIGNDVNDFWNNLLNGLNGVDIIHSFDTSNFEVKLAYEAKECDNNLISKRDKKYDSKFITFARCAAKNAYVDSKLLKDQVDSTRFAVYISTSIGGSDKNSEGINLLNTKGSHMISPYFLQGIMPNMAASKVAIDVDAKGSNISHVAACASGTISIGEAYLKIKDGYEDLILAGASESSITEMTIAGFQALRVIYRGNDKELASTPFDRRRAGFTIGEGAAVLLLEELEHAIKRKAKIYAEIVGYSSNSDACNIFSSDLDGHSWANVMNNAIQSANIEVENISYINAHGTGTVKNDVIETNAIKRVFKNSIPFVSSTKGQTGHMLAASGAIEALIVVKALDTDMYPYMINYREKDNHCDLNFIVNEPKRLNADFAISNSFGIGGHNACLVFKKWQGN